MLVNQSLTSIFKLLLGVFLIATLSACNLFQEDGTGGDEGSAEGGDERSTAEPMRLDGEEITFGAAKYIPWLPWYYAEQEQVFQQYSEEYGVNLKFQEGDYETLINKFVSGDLSALAITNIDAMSSLIRRSIQSDAIIITSYSDGNDAVVLPHDAEQDIVGKTIALKENSAAHYVLERYLLKNQIPFDDVPLHRVTSEIELTTLFNDGEVAGIASWNPYIEVLQRERQAKILFDSHLIPGEVFHMVLVRRDVLEANPDVGKALLATWFTVMERLQGNRRGATLDALAAIAEIENRASFDAQFSSIQLADNPVKALSILRDRRMRKTMRHIRFFMERHELGGNVPVAEWVSYPGRKPLLLHFNATSLQSFLETPL